MKSQAKSRQRKSRSKQASLNESDTNILEAIDQSSRKQLKPKRATKKKPVKRSSSDSKSKVSISASEQEHIRAIIDDEDLLDLALQVPLKIDHNTSADFINRESKKR